MTSYYTHGKVSILTVLKNWASFLFWLHLFKISVAVQMGALRIRFCWYFSFSYEMAKQILMPPTPGPDQVCDHQHWCSSHPPVPRGLVSYLKCKNEIHVYLCYWKRGPSCFQLYAGREVVLTRPESLGVSNSYQACIIHLSLEKSIKSLN